jgi:hypothetical protein
MLDYAANAVVYWPAAAIRQSFERTCQRAQQNADQRLSSFLGGAEPDSTSSIERFWQSVDTNLRARKIRLIFVADAIPPELRRVIEFLNEEMRSVEVLAIEIRQFVGPGIQTLVPTVIGQTAVAEGRRRGQTETKQWDRESFMAELHARKGDAYVEVAQRILRWSGEHCSRIAWGSGSRDGSLIPVFMHDGVRHYPFVVRTSGKVIIQGRWLRVRAPFDSQTAMQKLAERLNQIPSVQLRAAEMSGYPCFDLLALAENQSMTVFTAAMEWIDQEIGAASSLLCTAHP